MQELTRREALLRLGSVSFGRVVFTHRALPAIRPVNHITDNGRVIFRTHEGADIPWAAGAARVLAHGVRGAYAAPTADGTLGSCWEKFRPRPDDHLAPGPGQLAARSPGRGCRGWPPRRRGG
jgi:Pyridoxamine 5'-phosphate oxidase